MKIDTEIRHLTEPGANLFLELGFRQTTGATPLFRSENVPAPNGGANWRPGSSGKIKGTIQAEGPCLFFKVRHPGYPRWYYCCCSTDTSDYCMLTHILSAL